jgi:hypothetical protein
LSVNAHLPVVNISAGVNAALGYNNPASISQALGSAVNPPTYTSANCPEYPGASNPYCGVGGSPAAQPVQSASVSTWSPAPVSARAARSSSNAADRKGAAEPQASLPSSELPSSSALDAVESIGAALNGGQPPALAGMDTLVIYPILAAMDGMA